MILNEIKPRQVCVENEAALVPLDRTFTQSLQENTEPHIHTHTQSVQRHTHTHH